MRTVQLPSGEAIPVLGQGTWHMAEGLYPRHEEIEALRLGLDLGMSVIDTAELYNDGAAEELVGQAINGRRNDVFLVTKVLPHHATRRGTISACEKSLRRLGTDYVDLYLLHWRGTVPLEETINGFVDLAADGKIRYWGVSNFDVADMEELQEIPEGDDVQTNQVLYNVTRRGVEYDLLPWCRARDIPIMAYSPIEQGRLLDEPVLRDIAERHKASHAQIALAWVLGREGVMVIPKAGTTEHVRENHRALDIRLTAEDLSELDRAFPPPRGPASLETL